MTAAPRAAQLLSASGLLLSALLSSTPPSAAPLLLDVPPLFVPLLLLSVPTPKLSPACRTVLIDGTYPRRATPRASSRAWLCQTRKQLFSTIVGPYNGWPSRALFPIGKAISFSSPSGRNHGIG